jgi:hypothetical protein
VSLVLVRDDHRYRANEGWTIREGGPTIFAQIKNGKGVDHIVDLILSAWRSSGASVGGTAKSSV